MKHVFITGAAGFIGGYITECFVKQDWHVFALVHRTASPSLEKVARDGAVTIIHGDLKDVAAIHAKLTGELARRHGELDAIIHCGGRASDTGWHREFRKTNYEAVTHLADMSMALNAGRFVFISTTDVCGLRDYHGEQEDDLPLGARPSNPYPEFKIAAEHYIRKTMPSSRFSIIRPAQVWGTGDKTLTPRIVDFLRASPWIVHFGKWRGRNRWPLAHVRNVATTAFLAATTAEAAGKTINVVDDERTTMDEFYRLLARIYLPDKHFRTITLPFVVGQGFAFCISLVSNLLNLKRPFADPSYYALYAVSHNLDFGNRRMQALFKQAGCTPFTREAGIKEAKAQPSGRLGLG